MIHALDALECAGLWVQLIPGKEWLKEPYEWMVQVYDQSTREHMLVPIASTPEDFDKVIGAVIAGVPEYHWEVLRYALGSCAP